MCHNRKRWKGSHLRLIKKAGKLRLKGRERVERLTRLPLEMLTEGFFYQEHVLLVALGDGADGDGGELGLLLVHDVRRHVGGLARKLLKALVHLQARRSVRG